MMPWRNGAGTTTEIAVEPPGSELADQSYFWRISIADVTSSGAFSLFPGYDRTIMLLEGNGMVLDSQEGGSIDLSQPLRPKTFPGEWQVSGRLLSGPVRDFNLMIKRQRAASQLEVVELTQARRIPCPPHGTLVAYVVDGALSEAPAGHALIAEHALDLRPVGRATVVSIAITAIA
jgi:hypothetical protein